ncbi:ATP-binding cassette domain-containing protein [Anaerovorax odorimutans]|uniref:ATP-binding cassette domain-containing protein n=1 Tax=Anaerovorax odorimutans TaxID=109327 RepID=A0ABT1RLU4_9FIRM|nr:ATP-binding cassette domain-containing protein [Anaerovorax odorimutans]MCQ4636157.1 ATP-binding cassette domain-containing protein [Anaerovorax odorimutans]
MKMIETKGLTKYYGKSRGIIDLDLSVEQGEIYGFIGPNGAGKSTTIRLLLGLITPSSGQAAVMGRDCVRERTQILSETGYMPSEAMFYDNLRVKEVIDLSAKLHKKNCKKEAARLYEPTSGLDPLMQKEFFSLLAERNREGATIFLSSHVLSEIQRHCQSAAIIRDGRLIVSDSVEALSRTSARRVEIHGIKQPPAIDGIVDIDCGPDSVRFLYQGEMQALIASLSGLGIEDLSISEPDIEEIFMHFYNGGGAGNGLV